MDHSIQQIVKRVASGERQKDYLTLAQSCPHGIVESRDWGNLQH